MNKALDALKAAARTLSAAIQKPAFYDQCASELAFSRENFFDNPLIFRLREDVLPFLYEDLGLGIQHSKTVAVEAGAIVLAEQSSLDQNRARHLSLLAQFAGLLHDTCRLEDRHGARGAEITRIVLSKYPLTDRDRDIVAFSVTHHEATEAEAPNGDPEQTLVVSALHDADKFRWGRDHFITALWELCDYEDAPPAALLPCLDQARDYLARSEGSFRTEIGRRFGSEILAIGRALNPKITALVSEAARASLSLNQN